ncbi:MAG: HIT domain-containing protein [Anaerolineae bacterium]|nr:HIT domain-containing protein [Anaerolineae bacterium]
MKHLWSPWRMKYIQSPKDHDSCVFCAAIDQPDGPQNLVVHRGQSSFVMLNLYPYTSGHMMVLPFSHHANLQELPPQTRTEMMELMNTATIILNDIYRPEGFNLGANIGAAAGAGIEEHVHLHIVPRWNGDTNFMSSLGETRVLPETLEETYRRVTAAWRTQNPE